MNVEYIDKLRNKIKIVKINGGDYKIKGREVASNYRYFADKVIKLSITIKKMSINMSTIITHIFFIISYINKETSHPHR